MKIVFQDYDLYKSKQSTDIVRELLEKYDSDHDSKITMEEYLVWTVNNPLPDDFLDVLFQVCHIVLGLKPRNPSEEGQIVK